MYLPSDHSVLVNFANTIKPKFDINVRDYEFLVILACEKNRQDILDYILVSKSIPFSKERLSSLKNLEKNTKKEQRLTKKDFDNGPIKAIIVYGEIFTNIEWTGKGEVELTWDNKANELSCNDGGYGYSHYQNGIYVRYEGSEHVMKIIKFI